ncbi:NlpC/P60 family protein [Acidisoma sp. 7E03]
MADEDVGNPAPGQGCSGRRAMLCVMAGGLVGVTRAGAAAEMPSEAAPSSRSADTLAFSTPRALLDAGFDQPPWDDSAAEAEEPFALWERDHRHARDAAWGPRARRYPAPLLPRQDVTYRRERVLRVAARHIGLAYQHHHLPSWRPPADWPWLPVKMGHNGLGLDCSNFTAFVFNYALGLTLPTAVARQGSETQLPGPGGIGRLRALRIEVSQPDVAAALQPADLLYFRTPSGAIGHVALWLGAVGQGPVPLLIDCSQRPHRDESGNMIPGGVRIRPFLPGSWYARRLSHAHRVIAALG